MPFHVKYDSKINCVLTTITGDMDKELVGKFFAEIGRVAAAHNCTRILSDLRNAKIVAPGVDIYQMAQSLEKKKIQRSFRRAIVISQDKEDYAFWETVCFNLGYQNVKIFQDYDDAKQWVLQE